MFMRAVARWASSRLHYGWIVLGVIFLVLLASAAVVAAELFNTAIEHLADLLHPQQSPAIRLVKDCAAAGVLIAVLGALGVGAALLVHLLSGAL